MMKNIFIVFLVVCVGLVVANNCFAGCGVCDEGAVVGEGASHDEHMAAEGESHKGHTAVEEATHQSHKAAEETSHKEHMHTEDHPMAGEAGSMHHEGPHSAEEASSY